MKPGQPFAEGSSVINHWLTTATDGQNCRAARSAALAIGSLPILYTPRGELPLPERQDNRQGMFDSSRHKVWAGKRWARNRFATRRVANLIIAAGKATTEESSVVRTGEGVQS